MRRIIAMVVFLAAVPVRGLAQNIDSPHYRGEGYVFFGVGPAFSSNAGSQTSALVEVGAGGEGFVYKGLGLGGEVGYAHWGSYLGEAGLSSMNVSYHIHVKAAHREVDPFVLGGYTVVFNRSADNAAHFGGGVNIWMARHAGVRIEARYQHGFGQLSFPGLGQDVEFRVGLTFR